MPTTKESVTSPSSAGPFSIRPNGARHTVARITIATSGSQRCQLIPVSSARAIDTPPISAGSIRLLASNSAVSGTR